MTDRRVIVTIDDILRLFIDYLDGIVPEDAKAIEMLLQPAQRKVGIVAESGAWEAGLAPLEVKFDLRRIYALS